MPSPPRPLEQRIAEVIALDAKLQRQAPHQRLTHLLWSFGGDVVLLGLLGGVFWVLLCVTDLLHHPTLCVVLGGVVVGYACVALARVCFALDRRHNERPAGGD